MRSRIYAAPITIAAALALAGCSGDATPAPTVTVTETITAAPTVPAESSESPVSESTEPEIQSTGDERYVSHGKSPRGNLLKNVGDWAGISSMDDEDVMAADFRVTKITVDPKCSASWREKPKNDQYVKIDFEVETYPELIQSGDFTLTSHDFTVFDAEGKRVNDPQGHGYSCLDESDQLPSLIGPAEKVQGSIVLDVPKSATAFVYTTFLVTGGWEWTLDGNGKP